MNENDFNQLENPNMESTNEANVTFEEKPMEPARPIDAPIEEPITPIVNTPVESSPIDNGGKKKNPLTLVVIILLIALLGALGYIAYDRFFAEPKNDTKETTDVKEKEKKEETKEQTKEQVLTYNFGTDSNKYIDSEEHILGNLTLNNVEYRVSFRQVKCTSASSDILCDGTADSGLNYSDASYLTAISIGRDSQLEARVIIGEGAFDKIAVLDDRYLFIDTGMYNDRVPSYNDSVYVLDSKTGFKQVEELKNYVSYATSGYADLATSKTVNREIGYVDQNTFKIGSCNFPKDSSKKCAQKYIEYTITIKDGKIDIKESFSADNIQCSAQC